MKTATRILVNIALSFATAAYLLLMLGFAHGTDRRVPAFGYWTCWFLTFALTQVVTSALGYYRVTREKD